MPVRGRGSKVAKPRRGSRHSSLSSTAQEQLEHFAQHADSNVEGGDGGTVAATLGASQVVSKFDNGLGTASMIANGSSIASLDSSLQQALVPSDDFQVDQALDQHEDTPTPQVQTPQQTPQQSQQSSAPMRTAAEVALAAYGDLVKIDSALCKKLAGESALREPTQRRHDQKLNIERRSNVEALLAHMTGEVAARPCKNCHKGHGPWTQCVVYDGQMCGSCSNCWFNASGSRCTFHENNNPLPQAIYAPQVAAATTAPAIAPYHSAMTQPSPPTLDVAALHADIHQWGLTDPTRRMVSQAMGDVSTFSKRERYIARIEAAAKELGMRIAEYDEYLRTPEGMAECQRAQEQDHEHGSQPPDSILDDAASPASVLR